MRITMVRTLLLKASESIWLREQAARAPFVRRAVSRFMPGETFEDMLAATRALSPQGIGSVFTRLGENVRDIAEAQSVTDHYVESIGRIEQIGLACEPSVKLTQLGLDINRARTREHLAAIAARIQAAGSYLWIDMEQSSYVDLTLDLTEELRQRYPSIGVCVQAYLQRTRDDLVRLLGIGAGVRLVKGAYREPPTIALSAKHDVDANYLALGRTMIDDKARGGLARAVFGTHDMRIITALCKHARTTGVAQGNYEFHMLYGIQRREQARLASEGEHVRVLIAYGPHWFPWYMRRLAERPANVWFVVKSLFR